MPPMIRLALLVLLWTAPVLALVLPGPDGVAFAQSDDDDDDDDDGDDDDGGGGGRRGSDNDDDDDNRPRPRRNAPRQPAAAPAPLPEYAPELIVTDLSDADLQLLLAEGFTAIERRALTSIALTIDRLAVPQGLTLDQGRARVRQLASGGDADFNHYYRSDQAGIETVSAPACRHENCGSWNSIGWPWQALEQGSCAVTVPIGLIDTGINPDHDILQGADLQILPLEAVKEAPSQAVHGTAVASLLLGDTQSRVPGLLPGAGVVAVDIFSRVAGDERADAAALVTGLDMLAARQVRLINLSLSGPPNAVLARMLDRLTAPAGPDAVIVAAAGNGGPDAAPAWPAAHPGVIAVTALDARDRVYRRAQRGDHLALAAPGVNLLAATSVSGARAKTGTSFAVPFVTAAAALVLSRAEVVTGAEVRAALLASARDLGAAGPDPVFGHGALMAATLCAQEIPQAVE